MPSTATRVIDSLSAPEGDGQILVWPSHHQLRGIAQANHALLTSCTAKLLNRPLSQWRRPLESTLTIMAGHQSSFFHPGVWAKNVVAADLAHAIGGVARFVVVDSDVSHGVSLAWPEVTNGYCHTAQAMALPDRQSLSFEQLGGVDASDLHELLEKPRLTGDTAWSAFSDALCAPPMERRPFVTRWIDALKTIDTTLGVQALDYVRASQLFSAGRAADSASAAFVAHLLLNAPEFAAAYNAALADYRRARDIRGSDHPIPDLMISPERAECPFWILPPEQPRKRLFVAIDSSDRCTFWSGDHRQCEVSRRDLHDNPAGALEGVTLRPRALALTLYLRLVACDLFIHGVGGAKYDQITDDIARRFFRIEPPGYACVSATLRLPLPVFDIQLQDHQRIVRRLRDLRFNPQRVGAAHHSAEALSRRDAAIAEALRLRRQDPRNRSARRAAYDQIHQANSSTLEDADALAGAIRHSLDELIAKLASNRIARSREWCFAMYPTERLRALRESLRHPGKQP